MANTKTQESSAEQENSNNNAEFALQVELSIETDRILKVLDRTVEKLELLMCVPFLLEDNGRLLKKFLPADEIVTVKAAFDRYTLYNEDTQADSPESIETELRKGINSIRESILNHRAVNEQETSEHGEVTLEKKFKKVNLPIIKRREEAEVCRALQFMCNKPRIRMFMTQFLLHKIPEAGSIFIEYMRQLHDCIAKRLAVSPSQEVANEQKLRLAWIGNIKSNTDTAILQDKLEIQRNQSNALLVEKDVTIQKNLEQIEKMKKCSKDDIKKRINESEKNMVNDWRDNEIRQEILQANLIEDKAKYEQLLSEHLHNEKKLKAKKIKVESQLLTILNKYDADIGDLQGELDEIMDGFNEEKQQMRELKDRFDIQEVEHKRLMTEKHEEKMQELAHKVNIFIENRAARIIQRAWRKYRRRRKHRRKGKKRK